MKHIIVFILKITQAKHGMPNAAPSYYVSLIHTPTKSLKYQNKESTMNRRTRRCRSNHNQTIHTIALNSIFSTIHHQNKSEEQTFANPTTQNLIKTLKISFFSLLFGECYAVEAPRHYYHVHMKHGSWVRHWWMTKWIHKQTICGAQLSQNFLAVVL